MGGFRSSGNFPLAALGSVRFSPAFLVRLGGGIAIVGLATINITTITGNTAATGDNDVNGTFGA
jgi:hypothetical protein